MKLTDLDNKPNVIASKALAQNYEVPFNVDKMGMVNTVSMLNKVRGLMREAKEAKQFHQNQSSSSYMKLVFMEQALSHHYSSLKSQPRARIVVENEEVEKSQVVLAAQDMVDSTQKMLEEVSDMLVKELPALTTSISNEMGEESSQAFNQSVTEALTQLQAAITAARGGLQGALGGITGSGGAGFGADMDAGMGDMEAGLDDMEAGLDDMEAGGEEMDAAPMPAEEPDAALNGVGRAKR
jgi:hypothetical protein